MLFDGARSTQCAGVADAVGVVAQIGLADVEIVRADIEASVAGKAAEIEIRYSRGELEAIAGRASQRHDRAGQRSGIVQ